MISQDKSLKLSLMSFVAAVLVVCIHLPVTVESGFSMLFEDFFGSKISSVAVPFFFVVSGYLLANRMESLGYYLQLRKRVRSLLVPYLFWCLVLGLQGNLNSLLANILSHYPVMRHIEINPIRIFGLDMTVNPPLPLWFLRALMLYILISPALRWIAQRKYFLLVFIGALVIFDCTKDLYIPKNLSILFGFTLAPANILAFTLGLRFDKYPIRMPVGVAYGIGVSGILLFFFSSLLKYMGMHIPYAAGVIISLSAIALTLAGIWSVCPVVELPIWLRGQSFPVYLLHAVFVPYVLLAARKFPIMLSWFGFVVNAVLLLVGSLVLSHALHRCFPGFSKVIFGGR